LREPQFDLIAGRSCSGKTTLARLVALRTGARVFSLDKYWIRGAEAPLVGGRRSYEQPGQYDGERMAADAAGFLAAAPDGLAVVEGFLAFLYPGVAALCGSLVFVEIGQAEAAARRRRRAGSLRGVRHVAVEEAWLANGEAEWRRFGAAQREVPGAVRLDGSLPPEDLCEAALRAWGSRGGPR
jgi:uridine kinase